MEKTALLEVIKDFLGREGEGSLIVDTDELTVDWTPDDKVVEHGSYATIVSYADNSLCECGEYYNDECEQCTDTAHHLLEKVVEELEYDALMQKVEAVTRRIWDVTDGKLDDIAGVRYFSHVSEMLEKYELTLDELVDKSYGIADDVSILNKPFIVYDYSFSEFTYLTKFDEASIQQFIDELLAP